MRTRVEILDRLKVLANPDAPDRDVHDSHRAMYLVAFLPYRVAKRYLNPKIDRVAWAGVQIEPIPERVHYILREAILPAAWKAANARRADHVTKFLLNVEMMLWVLGDSPEDARSLVSDRFDFYGKPQLVLLCERFGAEDWPHWDDDRWISAKDELLILRAEHAMPAWRKGPGT